MLLFQIPMRILLQIISVSMVFIMKHFIQPHLEGRTCECTSSFTCTKSSMSWEFFLAERYVKQFVMVLLWKERICPKICQRWDFLTFLMFLYFRISVLTCQNFSTSLEFWVYIKPLYIWNTGTNTKYDRNMLIFDITCTTYHWYSLIVIVLFSYAKAIPKSHLIEATEQTHLIMFEIWSHWTPPKISANRRSSWWIPNLFRWRPQELLIVSQVHPSKCNDCTCLYPLNNEKFNLWYKYTNYKLYLFWKSPGAS